MCKETIAAKAAAASAVVPPIKQQRYAGPLGPTWQPIYDRAYAIIFLIFNLPLVTVITFVGIAVFTYRGDLKVTPIMPLVTVFIMARVPFVGCCMSNVLHRYFAHSAYRTSRAFQVVLALIGSMALQGGVLWWASKHIRHHKHCDEPLDPHSPTQHGKAYAWLGWLLFESHHDWVYLPKRFLTPEILVINMLFLLPNMLVTYGLTKVVGTEWALFLCWVPGIFGALATTNFNVNYHPRKQDRKDGECVSINKSKGDKGIGPFRTEKLAKFCPILFEPLVGEAYHHDHHAYPRRAHRPGYDMPYKLVLEPLSKMGLIWDLQQPLPTDPHAKLEKKEYPIVIGERDK